MTLLYIILATAIGGLVSVVIAATLTVGLLGRVVKNLVSLSAGVLLATALLQVLPEAFASVASAAPVAGAAGTDGGHAAAHAGEVGPHRPTPTTLFATLLAGLLFFWLLEKAELYRHFHHHEGDGHGHHHDFDAQQAGRGGLAVLVGDGVHNFCDGVIIAAAFLTDPALGVMTTLAVAAHEIPQEAGDFIVLLNAGFGRAKALAFNLLSGAAAVAGGVLGYFMVGPFENLLPYLLVAASSSFIYVAVADLLPQLQQRLSWRETAWQVAWLLAGLGVVVLARELLHQHAH
ncbi:MAG: ZIP family metal transporter [Burkholderiales bacterium]|nr:ZIP family metal transporter [Burkholderiales bacterium]